MRTRNSAIVCLMVAVALIGGCNQCKRMDIVDTAKASDDFDTLVTALAAADLVDALKGEGPFTVFAPTDAAFDKLPEGTLASLLTPQKKADLQRILKYHVVPGRLSAADVMNRRSLTTLEGKTVSIRMHLGSVMINDATVTTTDVDCTNGVIHAIDTVLMP